MAWGCQQQRGMNKSRAKASNTTNTDSKKIPLQASFPTGGLTKRFWTGMFFFKKKLKKKQSNSHTLRKTLLKAKKYDFWECRDINSKSLAPHPTIKKIQGHLMPSLLDFKNFWVVCLIGNLIFHLISGREASVSIINIHQYPYTYMHTCIHTFTYIHTNACMYTLMYICKHI